MLLENILRTLLQELVSATVESGEAIMQYGQSIVDEDARPGQIPRLLDIVLYLCEKEHVEGGMIFQLLEDLTEMSTMRNCKDVFGYIESKQDILGKPELFASGKLVMLRTCNQLLRRLSKANDVVFCGRIIMFLAHFFPLSERSAVNIKGVFNTSNETKYEKEAPESSSIDFNFYKTFWSLQESFSNPASLVSTVTKWQKFTSSLTVVLSTFEAQPLSDEEGNAINLEDEASNFSIKYLTSSNLMGLELKDPSFRRHILVQCLILFDYLKAPGKNDKDFPSDTMINAALNDEVPSVRSAACRAIGVIACFPQIYHSTEVLEKFIHAAERNARDSLVSVRITASWAIANICDSLGHCLDALHAGRGSIDSMECSEFTSLLVESALRLARDNDKVKANAVRGLGNLARSIQFTKQLPVHGDPLDSMNSKFEYPDTQGSKAHMKERSHLFPTSSGGSDWLEQMVQAFLSCVTSGNVKVQWNVCHALSNLFLNKSLKLQDMDWVSSVFSILLLLLRDSSNFKIRIQAAAALAVPETIKDYGKSYYDVVKSVVHVVESFKSDQISEPSNFKYWIALEKQLTSTMLHLLGLASRCDQRAMQDLLVKKASFLEVWIEGLCSSFGDTSNSLDEAKHVSVDQKKDVIFRTIRSLVEVYKSSNHDVIAQRFDKLGSSLL